MILIQCFVSYISPMEWRYVIVALVPERLLEFLDAPLPTIFGIHASLLNSEEVQRVCYIAFLCSTDSQCMSVIVVCDTLCM